MERQNIESMAGETLLELFQSVRRHKLTAIVTSIIVACGLGFIVMMWPNRYASDGLLYVRLGRGAVSVDPTAAQSTNTISLMESRKSEVNSAAKMLDSREIAERTVRKLGAEEVNRSRNWVEDTLKFVSELVPDVSPGSKDKSDGGMTAEEYENQVAFEDAVERVKGWISINVPKDSHTVSLWAESTDPMLTQAVVQTYMDEYQAYHIEAHRATGSLQFFQQQVDESKAAALAAREQLEKTKNEMGWSSVESAQMTLQARIVEIEALRAAAKSKCAEAESQAEALESRLAQLDKWVPTTVLKGLESKAGQDMRTELFGLQLEGSEAIAKYKPGHPRYKLVKQMMARSEDILGKQDKKNEHTTEAMNPVYQSVQQQLEATAAQSVGLKSSCETLENSLAEAKDDLKRLNSDAVTLTRLQWASEIAEKNYLTQAASLEEARVSEALDSQQMSDVTVIQNASLNLKKSGPPRLIMLLLACMLGGLTGILAALARGAKNGISRRVYEPELNELLTKTDGRNSHVDIGQLVSS